jgi:hypothetical protein
MMEIVLKKNKSVKCTVFLNNVLTLSPGIIVYEFVVKDQVMNLMALR